MNLWIAILLIVLGVTLSVIITFIIVYWFEKLPISGGGKRYKTYIIGKCIFTLPDDEE